VIVALAQINPTVGDFLGNQRKIEAYTRDAAQRGARLVVFPEMAICGYPPGDLLERPAFTAKCQQVVDAIAQLTTESGISILCGTVTPSPNTTGKRRMNSAVLLQQGRVVFTQSKRLLPYYDVFDEQRYFAPAETQRICTVDGRLVAITICEDAWNDKNFWPQRLYSVDPVEHLMQQGAGLILNLSASPYHRDKRALRMQMLSAIAQRHQTPVLMVNQVGGNDSLIFDGSSLAIAPDGRCMAQAASFAEDLVLVDLETMTGDQHATHTTEEDAAVYEALVLGTRDYVRKCGFSKAVVGLSGGIDSALVACIATEALGKENVLGVGMPSEYSSQGSIDDARQLAENLGIAFELLPIQPVFETAKSTLAALFAGLPADTTEENLQSRIRGLLLMALSNKLSALVLTTGNKSEMSVGYCTLYGDMVGALAVIGDVFKTVVYRLSRWVNREREVIPGNTLTKAPSAELRPEQKDTDSLPPYDVLDPILEAYVEHYLGVEGIAAEQGQSLDLVRRVVQLVERSEYKRQQAAPVLKVTQKSFGSGRRFPIAVKVQV
jgi:NAD+ synthase (glutamine-hydrolysing)